MVLLLQMLIKFNIDCNIFLTLMVPAIQPVLSMFCINAINWHEFSVMYILTFLLPMTEKYAGNEFSFSF